MLRKFRLLPLPVKLMVGGLVVCCTALVFLIAGMVSGPDPAPTAVRSSLVVDFAQTELTPTDAPVIAAVSTRTASPTLLPTNPPPTRTRSTTSTQSTASTPSTATPVPPTPTEIPPTNTPRPTSTPRPTATPLPPTPTLIPPSPTLPPTATAVPPTATSAPTATLTPLPTATLPPPTATLPPATATSTGTETATVTNIVDGDTIDVNLNGAIHRVRYIGIDTPEYNQTCGTEASQANAALVLGRTVTMVRDVSETDQFGRLLRYVYVGNTFVNGELVAQGWAVAREYPPDTRLAATLASLMAQGAGRGCALVSQPLPTQPPPAAPPPAATQPSGNCDPSYPTVCIPPYPPDLDCGDIPYRRFQVLPPDPHGFDGDHDGIGCESG